MPESIAVSVKNVSKQFDNVEVLRDINLTVEKGTVVSILGRGREKPPGCAV
ncbi:ABC transporter [Klebsiella pneumoniae]|nr:ABC transporter [Klebsiella pneumoniae]